MSKTRVLVVEDEPIIAQDISDFLIEAKYTCVGIAHNSENAFDLLINRSPDIALLDINIGGNLDGIDLGKVIREKYKIPFIFLTSLSDKKTLDKAKLTLPYGYIVKPFKGRDLISAIEMAIFRHSNENISNLPSISKINSQILSSLTDKEYECLVQLFDGLTNQQMADSQFVSINTIKTHLKRIFVKLDVSNRTNAINKLLKLR